MTTPTFTPIASQILASSASTVSFTGFPTDSTYRDLVLVVKTKTLGVSNAGFRFNSATGNYSYSFFGSSPSNLVANSNDFSFNYGRLTFGHVDDTTGFSTYYLDIMEYTQAKLKTVVSQGGKTSGTSDNRGQTLNRNTWHTTSAITSIDFISIASSFAAGSEFELYGIVA